MEENKKKYSAEWWVQSDLDWIRKMKDKESCHTSFGGEYVCHHEDGCASWVEVFGPDDSYQKFFVT